MARSARSKILPVCLLLALGVFSLFETVNIGKAFVGAADEEGASLPSTPAWKPSASLIAGGTVLLSCLILTTEPSASPPPGVTVLEKRVDYTRVTLLSAWLSILSGMVNAVCILDMAMTVAHHTGNASHVGRLFGVDHSRFLNAMLGFFAGALVAGFNNCSGETLYAGRYSAGLLSAALAVAGAVAVQYMHESPLLTVPLLAFSQGIQNAVSRKHSALPICTTHMTGYLTDFGSGTGAWLGAQCRGSPAPTLKRPFFFCLSIVAFGAGGVVAKKAWDSYGILAALAPAALMGITSLGVIPARQEKQM